MSSLFQQLEESLTEAKAISDGLFEPAKVTIFELPDVKAIRKGLQLSQAEFGDGLGISIDSIGSWEQGRRNPTGIAAKTLRLIAEQPDLFYIIAKL